MQITQLAVRRPVAILAIFLAVALGGLLAYLSLPINLYPNVNIPVVAVVTTYPGAGPEDVELQITRRIEDAVAGLPDIDNIQSSSTEGISRVTITFTEHANKDLIGSTVERQVNTVLAQLPTDVDRPIVYKADLAQLPAVQIALVGDALPPEDLYRTADEVLRPAMEGLSGVALVSVVGGQKPEVRVEVDPARLEAYGLSLADVQTALATANLNVPAGTVAERGREYSLRLYGLYRRAEDLGQIAVGNNRERPIHLSDVATVRQGAQDQRQISRVNGKQAVVVSAAKQNDANLTDVADGVHAALPRLRELMPPGSELIVTQDNSKEIRSSVNGVRDELLTAVLLTGGVLLLFLHRFRVSAIVLVSIPATLLATMIAMQMMSFSLNFLSMLGLTLTIGILVDDSIVVLENILRRLSAGDAPQEAAIRGRSEIGLAAVAITLVDVVVFAPVGLVTGQIGAFFREFGFTIAAATLISLVVSFTLTPMLAGRLLTNKDHDGGRGPLAAFGRAWDRGFAGLERRYRAILGWGLRHRFVVLAVAASTIVVGVALIATGVVGNEFFPEQDEGTFTISTEAPPGTALERHNTAMREVERRLFEVPEVVTVQASVGTASDGNGFSSTGGLPRYGSVTVEVQPRHTGRRPLSQIIEDVRGRLRDIPELKATVKGTNNQPVGVRIQGSDNARLAELAGAIEAELRQIPGLRDIENGASVGSPELRILVDRARAADMGVNAQSLGAAIRTAYNGNVATKIRRPDGREVDVRVVLKDSARSTVGSITDLPIVTATGTTVRLGQVAAIEQVDGPTQVSRRNRQRQVTVNASLSPEVTSGSIVPLVRAAMAKVPVPPGYTVEIAGSAEANLKAFGQLFAALGASILLAYLLLTVLYNSFLDPFAILFSLPVAIGGAIGGLAIFRYNFSLFALIGLILLVGLAIKNGVLLIDRARHNHQSGMTVRDALLEAGPVRLRPILMTSTTICAALLPTALQLGEGAELRAPLAAAVLGGVVSSTLLTLLVVPVIYTLLWDLHGLGGKLRRPFSRRRPATATAPAAAGAETVPASAVPPQPATNGTAARPEFAGRPHPMRQAPPPTREPEPTGPGRRRG